VNDIHCDDDDDDDDDDDNTLFPIVRATLKDRWINEMR